MEYCQEDNEGHQQCMQAEDNLGFLNLSAQPQASMQLHCGAVIYAKGASTNHKSIYCKVHGHTFQYTDISVLKYMNSAIIKQYEFKMSLCMYFILKLYHYGFTF
ncbi:hypothetical protein CHARACLAT_001526 [Characodon lateralis]|uniref:Uncharacterized protein n=1 Tax=Characodon lateralis TaxID=208331 RepID=A0ABU7CTW7_9TELE|nr:hypothetical protein [Characodon lateralis]